MHPGFKTVSFQSGKEVVVYPGFKSFSSVHPGEQVAVNPQGKSTVYVCSGKQGLPILRTLRVVIASILSEMHSLT